MQDRDAYDVLQVKPDSHQTVIQAAFRALAALYHPDGQVTTVSMRSMAELNDAYAKVRSEARRAMYDEERRLGEQAAMFISPTGRSGPAPPPPDDASGGPVIDFGRYQGWSIARLARQDPDYLRWLARHSSGIRFRSEIERVLAAVPSGATVSEGLRGR